MLFVLLFPPLRSSSRSYAEPQLVDQRFEAWQLSRFQWSSGVVATNPKGGFVARTEVDGGELLRELAVIVVLFGAAYYFAPMLADQYAKNKSDVTPDA